MVGARLRIHEIQAFERPMRFSRPFRFGLVTVDEAPQAFASPGMLYHPVKPGVPAWRPATKNARPPAALEARRTAAAEE